jgi:hypothetical protein
MHAFILKRLGRRSLEFHNVRVLHQLALYKLESASVYVHSSINAFLKVASIKLGARISFQFNSL